ncbi:MAG: sulfatase [Planctomycetota bacterium]|jgi:arylsulfatase A-like enzyme
MLKAMTRWAVLVLLVMSMGLVSRAAEHTNVVVVLVDDLGWIDLSCQGSDYYVTPNIDRLAREGVRFTNAYASCAVCSPSRAAIMTGRYPARTGITDWIRAKFQRGGIGTPDKNPTEYVGGANRKLLCPPNPYWMEHEEVTLAEVLKAEGYVTCHIGKWHLGDEAWYPEHQGFDFNYGGCDLGQPPSYFDPYHNPRYSMPTLTPRQEGQYLTHREAEEAVDFIKRSAGKPFFLYLANYAVHTPIQAIPEVAARYERGDKQKTNADYAAMVESVDDAVGAVMDTLRELGLEQDTMIIFTSDNGGLDNKGRPTENAPLRSGKGYAYEGGIRVPMIIKWPGHTTPGTVSHEPVIGVDVFPTVLDALGVERPSGVEVDGRSLVALLNPNRINSLNREAIYWHFPHYRHAPGPYSIVRAGKWKMIHFYEPGTNELFDLAADLGETTDLADKRKQVVRRLSEKLFAHLEAVGAKMPRPNPDYKGK